MSMVSSAGWIGNVRRCDGFAVFLMAGHALKSLPTQAPVREQLQHRLAEVLAEQEVWTKIQQAGRA